MWRNKKYKNHPKNKKNRNYLLLGPPSRFFDFSPKKIQKKKIQKKKPPPLLSSSPPKILLCKSIFGFHLKQQKKKKKPNKLESSINTKLFEKSNVRYFRVWWWFFMFFSEEALMSYEWRLPLVSLRSSRLNRTLCPQ